MYCMKPNISSDTLAILGVYVTKCVSEMIDGLPRDLTYTSSPGPCSCAKGPIRYHDMVVPLSSLRTAPKATHIFTYWTCYHTPNHTQHHSIIVNIWHLRYDELTTPWSPQRCGRDYASWNSHHGGYDVLQIRWAILHIIWSVHIRLVLWRSDNELERVDGFECESATLNDERVGKDWMLGVGELRGGGGGK